MEVTDFDPMDCLSKCRCCFAELSAFDKSKKITENIENIFFISRELK